MKCERILVVSPDTNVHHIGLPLASQNKQVMVQISQLSSRETKFIHLPALITALQNDPDLAGMDSTELTKIMQALLVCTGCDYVSFFSGIGISSLFLSVRFLELVHKGL